ncbi:hypothetical protein [Thalassospira xiamenensis]|uniref:Uncharacterized protein n=1 Tax=Thalassospira xiamenensis TaxID=220697 RepID=A0A285THW0_9PROT|nr:hypothetical protein [Thalassospira xiamenensis]SOC21770.1 hypothetical protein SAMN05428964_103482 [Thalassospira xiamenensis]
MEYKISVDDGVKVPDEDLAEIQAHYAIPGETVCLDKNVSFIGETQAEFEARKALYGAMVYTVSKTGLELFDGGVIRVYHEFVGHPGRHFAKAFRTPGVHSQINGILFEEAGQLWLVELSKEFELHDDARAIPIGGNFDRLAKNNIAGFHEMEQQEERMELFLSEVRRKGAAGLFLVLGDESTGFELGGLPMGFETHAEEVAAAKAIVTERTAAAASPAPAL